MMSTCSLRRRAVRHEHTRNRAVSVGTMVIVVKIPLCIRLLEIEVPVIGVRDVQESGFHASARDLSTNMGV